MKLEHDIEGSGGGKGGGGGSFSEADNTLKSNSVVRTLHVLSEGPVRGIVNADQGIFLGNTAIGNADGTKNYGGKVAWAARLGHPTQTYMEGFPSSTNEVNVSTDFTVAAPVVYTVSSGSIDRLRLAIQLPDGLAFNDTSNNSLVGTTVEFRVERRLGAGPWVAYQAYNITGKTTSTYERSVTVGRPSGTGLWSVRIIRITPDNGSATLKNRTRLARVTEIQDVKLEFPDVAYLGVEVDAATVNSGRVPTLSVLLDGIISAVPSNYDPVAHTFTGLWNGQFKNAWHDDPAWVLYDLLTNERYGLGTWITAADIDAGSFYEASVYNNATVTTGGVPEPRFTFNYPLDTRRNALELCQEIAGTFNARLVWTNGRFTVFQDRPASPVRLITTSNVVDGLFTYIGNPINEVLTAIHVSYNDPAQQYRLQKVTLDKDTTTGTMATQLATAQAIHGYRDTNITAVGATSEATARRAGLWKLDTVLNQAETVKFRMFINGYDLSVWDIVSLYDETYAGPQQAGRLLAGSTTTSLVLDRPVTITGAGNTVTVQNQSGAVETRTISETTGTLSTVTLTAALSAPPVEHSDFIVTTTVAPRQFRIVRTSLDAENGTVEVEAVSHDPNKYARIEGGVVVPPPVYSSVPNPVPAAPSNLNFTETNINDNNVIVRRLTVSWSRPNNSVVSSFRVRWQVNNSGWQTIDTPLQSVELPGTVGVFEVAVSSVGFSGLASQELTGTYTIDVAGVTTSPLNAVTGLTISGGGTTFGGMDVPVVWTNPISNASVTTATLRDFEVTVLTTADVVLATYSVPAVVAGFTQRFTYSYADNLRDGGPRRSFKVQVRCRDANNRLSAPTVATFSNPAPAVPSNISLTGGIGSVRVSYTLPTDTDFGGILIWRSTVNNFTPAAGNLIYDGADSFVADNAISTGVTYYYRIAAYDTFSKDLSGAGLNISAQFSAVPIGIPSADITGLITNSQIQDLAAAKVTGQFVASQIADGAITIAKFASGLEPIEIVSTLPSTGNFAGRTAFLSTDNKLYRHTGSAWTAAVDGNDLLANSVVAGKVAAGAIGATEIAAGAIRTNHLLVSPKSLNTDASFEGGSARWTGFVRRLPASDAAVPASCPTSHAAEFNSRDGIVNSVAALDVVPGEQYRASCWVNRGTGSGGAGIGIVAVVTNAAGSNVAALVWPSAVTTAAGWVRVTGVYTIPANGVRLRFGPWADRPTYTGEAWYADLIVEKVNDASLIVDGTISAAKMAANSVTATSIAADSVLATKLTLVDASNAYPDYDMRDASFYTLAGGATLVSSTFSTVGRQRLNIPVNAADVDVRSNAFQVEPNAEYYVEVGIGRVDGTTGAALCAVEWQSMDGAGALSPISNSVVASTTTQLTSNTRLGASVVAPANARRLRLLFRRLGGGDGQVSFGGPVVRRRANANLIVDGSIIATKMAADSVAAINIVGNTITADKFVTGLFQADNVVTRGLTVRDNSGNVILSSGTPLATAYLAERSRLMKNLVDSSWWSPSVSPGSRWFLNADAGTSNYFLVQPGPDGRDQVLWEALESTTNSEQAGGWNGSFDTPGTNSFIVDETRTYLFACYIRRNAAPAAFGYWGLNTSGALVQGSDGNNNSNPYFAAGESLAVAGRWYLFVGYVYPSGATGWNSNPAGVYDTVTGQKIAGGASYRWGVGTTNAWCRAYNYYAPQGSIIQFASPIVTLCDGNEPAISDLLSMATETQAMASVRPLNPITSGNVTTFISGTAIGNAQIQNAAIGSAQIQNAAVGAAQIANASINSLKIGGNAATVVTAQARQFVRGSSVTITITANDIPSGFTTVPVLVMGTFHVSSQTFFSIGWQAGTTFDCTNGGNIFFAQPPGAGCWAAQGVVNLGTGTYTFACYGNGAPNINDSIAQIIDVSVSAVLAKR